MRTNRLAATGVRGTVRKVDMRFLAILGVLLTVGFIDPIADGRAETGFLDRSIELNGQTYRYQVYVPADYTADQSWPVVLDLHSAGPLGTDGLRHTTLGTHGLANYIRQDRTRLPI